ncbi:DUF1540 domain-containing protein [[Eubacterium] hominis]|uniref:DUF1540 domain-containing protein n=1 Tax=[Eubacterium] hominis TaxID=2764325 RepID=UPI003A4DAAF8
MQKKTEILCNVHSCVYHKDNRCEAETISVCCDNCVEPNQCHETECKSFRCKCGK